MKQKGVYYVYITTNQHRTVLYTGMGNDVAKRAGEHQEDAVHIGKHFTGWYQSFYVVYYETYQNVLDAIAREKQIKAGAGQKN